MKIEALSRMTIEELTQGYRVCSIDPVEVMACTLDQVARVNGRINALYGLEAGRALTEAHAASQRYRSGQSVGVLDGVPVTIKDSVQAVGMRWHHGSSAHGAGVVGTKDSPPVERLKAAGAIIFAKGAMPDYGLSGSGVSSFHGIVRNPWGLRWSSGGSSAGCAASLAAGIGMMSVGSDIAGSVRLPASHCGLAALKPTQGMIPHTPASDIRSAGPMTRHAADLELLLDVLGGVHADDRFSVPVMPPPNAPLSQARVDACADFGFGPKVERDVLAVFENARNVLASIVSSVEPVETRFDFDACMPINESFKLRGWREYAAASDEHRDKTPRELVEWFAPARTWTAAKVAEFEQGIARGVAQANAMLDGIDFLLTPVMPVVNFAAEALGPDPAMPLRHCTFTALSNQSGHPAVAICAGFDPRGLPVGVQIVGHRFDDVRLVRLAAALERALRDGDRQGQSWPVSPTE